MTLPNSSQAKRSEEGGGRKTSMGFFKEIFLKNDSV